MSVAYAAINVFFSWTRRLGLAPVAADWQDRAAICEQCALRVVRCGVSYCGTPFLQQIDRDPAIEGCGCPCREKAKAPEEHCPLTKSHHPRAHTAGDCNCKWCDAGNRRN